MNEQTVYTDIKYVNPRDQSRNRPANIKDGNNQYYSFDDVALQMVQTYQGQQVNLTFATTPKGYKVAKAINGQQLPTQQRGYGGGGYRGGGQQQAQPQGQPQGQPQAPAQKVTKKDLGQWYSDIAKSCIETGLDGDQYFEWLRRFDMAMRLEHQKRQPPQQQYGGHTDHQAPVTDHPQGQGAQVTADDLDDEIPF